jgi:glycosyltransferase involved in cell wall biosynthesis
MTEQALEHPHRSWPQLPLISCLTVTAGRLRFLKEAIRCYVDQTYPNRELVIVTSDGEAYRRAVSAHVDELDRSDIRLVAVDDPSSTLGRLRNISLAHARGDVICQWDDDDLYHPDRLSAQFEAMSDGAGGACFLNEHLQFFVEDKALVWVDWAVGTFLERRERLVPQSLMVYRDDRLMYPEAGPASRHGEDDAIRAEIYASVPVVELPLGHLYLYRFHGHNTQGEAHHRHVAAFGSRTGSALSAHLDRLREAIGYYRLPMPYRVVDRDGRTVLVVHR